MNTAPAASCNASDVIDFKSAFSVFVRDYGIVVVNSFFVPIIVDVLLSFYDEVGFYCCRFLKKFYVMFEPEFAGIG